MLDTTQSPTIARPVNAPAVKPAVQGCVAIGISTGGPPALTSLLSRLMPPLPPIVIVQHMPAAFTGPLAMRLGSLSALMVREAADGLMLQNNQVLIAPGGRHLRVHPAGHSAKIEIFDGPTVSGHRPSVDVMMASVAKAFGGRCLGVIMTGMGHDGVAGCRDIRTAGGFVLGQDQASSEVYGMNKAAFVEGHVNRQFAIINGAAAITQQLRAMGLL